MIRALPPSKAGTRELALTVEFSDDADDALLRVLSTLHRRRCRVTAAEFAADRAAPGRVALRIQAPSTQAGHVGHWLNSLIDVRQVSTTAPPAASDGSEPRVDL